MLGRKCDQETPAEAAARGQQHRAALGEAAHGSIPEERAHTGVHGSAPRL